MNCIINLGGAQLLPVMHLESGVVERRVRLRGFFRQENVLHFFRIVEKYVGNASLEQVFIQIFVELSNV